MNRIFSVLVLSVFILSAPSFASVTFNTAEEMEASFHIATGIQHAQDGKLDEAIAEFKKALEIMPEADEARFNMSLIYMDKGEFNEASENFQMLYDKYPDDIGLNYNYGVTLLELGRNKEALPKLEKVFKENPDDKELESLIEKARKEVE